MDVKTTPTDKLKNAETLLIKAGNDPLLRAFPILTLGLIPAMIDLVHIVRDLEERVKQLEKNNDQYSPG